MPNQGPNFVLAMTSFSVLSYTGETITPTPIYSVYQLSTALSLYTDFQDSIRLSAYSDSNCTNAAAGTVSASVNPVTFSSGLASFENVSFNYTAATQLEGKIYLRGVTSTWGVGICSVGLDLIQHFSRGAGYVLSGSTGAAGASGSGSVYDQATRLQIDQSGKYVLAGVSKNSSGGQEIAIWRYLQNGMLDVSYNSSGYFHSGILGAAGATGASVLDKAQDFKLDSTGRYVVVGSSKNSSGGTQYAIWRVLSTGVFDAQFNSVGIVVGSSSGVSTGMTAATVTDSATSVQIDSQNRLVVLVTTKAASGATQLAVLRYSAAGVLDTTFGNQGIFQYGSTGIAGATGASVDDQGKSLALDSQERILITGSSRNSVGGRQAFLIRLTSNGGIDSTWTFANKTNLGSIGASGASQSDSGNHLLIDSKGKYVITGSSKNSSGGTELTVWRVTSSGAMDTAWNGSGVVHFGDTGLAGATSNATLDQGWSTREDTSSNYIISGSTKNIYGGTELGVWRYTSTGSLDSNWNGKGSISFGAVGVAGGTGVSQLDQGLSIALDFANTAIVVGSSVNASGGTEMAVWRFLPIGILDF